MYVHEKYNCLHKIHFSKYVQTQFMVIPTLIRENQVVTLGWIGLVTNFVSPRLRYQHDSLIYI